MAVIDARAAAQAHLVPHFTSAAMWSEDRWPMLDRGEGAYVWTTDGVRYLDGLSGLFCNNLGHGRTDLVEAMAAQAARLPFGPCWGMTHTAAAAAADAVTGYGPDGLDRVFFVSSGSEAVESAMKLARCFHVANGEPQRTTVVARRWAYHGTTLGALSATGIPKLRAPFEPMLRGVVHAPTTREVDDPAAALEAVVLEAGPETVSMVLAEPVQNGGGAIVPPDGYWAELRRICDRHGILLCADEVITGFGRIGAPFASERFGIRPDLATFAKGVTSAYVPMGGVLASSAVVDTVDRSPMGAFLHGSTFGAHPVAAAVAVATIDAMRREAIPDAVRTREPALRARLDALRDAHDTVAEVRGAGFFYALELTGSRTRGIPLTAEQSAELLGGLLVSWVWEERLLIRADDRGATMLVVSPPLTSDDAVLDELTEALARVLDRVDGYVAGGLA
jgi:adenosylmethionine-8-amino-7-oxononanoate aminotransferase